MAAAMRVPTVSSGTVQAASGARRAARPTVHRGQTRLHDKPEFLQRQAIGAHSVLQLGDQHQMALAASARRHTQRLRAHRATGTLASP